MQKYWDLKQYKLDHSLILTDQIVERYINLFWKDVMSTLKDDQYILFLFRVKFEGNQIATLCDMQKITKDSKDLLISFIINRLIFSNESYKTIPIDSIIFSYGIRDGIVTSSLIKESKDIKYHIYYKNELPIAMLPEDYGIILSKFDNNYTISVNRGKKSSIIILTVNTINNQTVNNIKYFKDNNLLFTWTDTIISLEKKKFIRRIGKSILHYENSELVLYTIIKKTSSMAPKKLPKNNKLLTNFITMDLETININNKLVPYLLCWFDGNLNKKKSYFILPPQELQDLNNLTTETLDSYILDMINDAITDICIRKYKNYKVYLHNFLQI